MSDCRKPGAPTDSSRTRAAGRVKSDIYPSFSNMLLKIYKFFAANSQYSPGSSFCSYYPNDGQALVVHCATNQAIVISTVNSSSDII